MLAAEEDKGQVFNLALIRAIVLAYRRSRTRRLER